MGYSPMHCKLLDMTEQLSTAHMAFDRVGHRNSAPVTENMEASSFHLSSGVLPRALPRKISRGLSAVRGPGPW